ncbi:hypothetical protein EI77_02295 [Prosthecobacter fusiformis]|uniref:Uncharacterized protein n=1 Tax=Prosthecobacter fusiformis TaxID=48464 RepID=A0A4V3FFK6_9BACT|nr:hypothetical protein EI77_02295 [Prosthecobacter fusiformis]
MGIFFPMESPHGDPWGNFGKILEPWEAHPDNIHEPLPTVQETSMPTWEKSAIISNG